MNNNISRFKKYMKNDCGAKYILLKVNNKEALESMKHGLFWFRHPALKQFKKRREK